MDRERVRETERQREREREREALHEIKVISRCTEKQTHKPNECMFS